MRVLYFEPALDKGLYKMKTGLKPNGSTHRLNKATLFPLLGLISHKCSQPVIHNLMLEV